MYRNVCFSIWERLRIILIQHISVFIHSWHTVNCSIDLMYYGTMYHVLLLELQNIQQPSECHILKYDISFDTKSVWYWKAKHQSKESWHKELQEPQISYISHITSQTWDLIKIDTGRQTRAQRGAALITLVNAANLFLTSCI